MRCPASRAVSFAVSLSRHSVDLRACCYDTDAQDLARLLLGVVTRSPNESHGVQGVAGSNPAVPTCGIVGPVGRSAAGPSCVREHREAEPHQARTLRFPRRWRATCSARKTFMSD